MNKFSTAVLRSLCRNVKPMSLTALSKMNFATPKVVNESGNKLLNLLENQIKYQKENPPQLDESLSALEKLGWKLQSTGTLNEITKQVNDKTVHIVFFSRSPQAEPEKNEQTQQEEEMPDYCEFTIYVKRPGFDDYLYGDFVTSDGDLTLSSANFTKDYIAHRSLSKFERTQSIYQGPELDTMDEDLVNGFHSYFQELGLSDQLVAFIEQYSVDSEHTFYVKWLSDLKTFVQ